MRDSMSLAVVIEGQLRKTFLGQAGKAMVFLILHARH